MTHRCCGLTYSKTRMRSKGFVSCQAVVAVLSQREPDMFDMRILRVQSVQVLPQPTVAATAMAIRV